MRKLIVKLFSLALVLVLLGAYIPVNAATTNSGIDLVEGNIAYLRDITTNFKYTTLDIGVQKVVDGDPDTGMTVLASKKQKRGWITIDFGAVANYNKVVICKTGDNVTKYNLAYSNNNADWTTITSGTTLEDESVITFEMVTSRYLKFNAIDTEAGPVFNEIAVYNETDAETYPDGAPAAVSAPNLPAPTEVENMPYSKEDLHVYLFIGQSNMNGRDAIPLNEMVVQERAFLLNADEKWEYAQPAPLEGAKTDDVQGFNRYSTIDGGSLNGMNSAVSFSRAITAMVPDVGVGIVCNSKGGTGIMQWQKGSVDGFYEEAVRRASIAMETGTLKGICWLQGEADAAEDDYFELLNNIATGLRNELGVTAEEVPFIVGMYPPQRTAANANIVNVAKYIANSDYVSNEGTKSIDDLHYDAASQRKLGLRYAVKFLDSTYDITTTERALAAKIYNETAPLFRYELGDDFAYSQGVGNWYYMYHTRVDKGFDPTTLVNMTASVSATAKEWKYVSGSSTIKAWLDANGAPTTNSHTSNGSVVVGFKAPFAGTISIDAAGTLKRTASGSSGASVDAYVFKGSEQLSKTPVAVGADVVFNKLTQISVNKGDYIYFATNTAAGASRDLRWNPVIEYTDVANMETTYVLSEKYSSEAQGDGGFYYMAQPDITTAFSENGLKQMIDKSEQNYGTVWSYNDTTPYIYMAGRNLKVDNGPASLKTYPIFASSPAGKNAVVAWKAPYSGTICVSANGNITVKDAKVSGSGISMPCRLYMGNNLIWEGKAPRAMNNSLAVPEKKLYVNKGDSLYFVVERYNSAVSEIRVAWDPIIKYTEFGKSDYEILSNIYKDDAVTSLKDVKANDQVNVSVNVSSDTGFDNVIKGKAIVAFYKDSALVDLSVADYDNKEVMVPVTMIKDGNELAMRVFVLKDFISLTPLSEAFTID